MIKIRYREKWRIWLTALLLSLLIRQGNSAASTKAVTRKTVVNYYYLLPDSYFEHSGSKTERKGMLSAANSISDLKNDYIRVQLDALGTLEVAVFRYKGRDLIAVRRYYEGCMLWFFRYQEGRWKDVTKQIMPVAFNRKYDYVLPRYGTTIQVRRDLWPSENRGRKIYDLIWRKGRFQVRD